MQNKSSGLIHFGIVLFFVILTSGISLADEVNVEYVSQFGEGFSHIVVDGNYAYLAQDKDFVLVDITDVSNPSEVGRVSLPSKIADIDVSDKYACVVDEYDFYLVDVINTDSPSILGNCDIGVSSNTKAVAVSDNYACVVVEYGLVILDINNPSSPKITSSFDDTLGYSFFHGVDVDVSGKYAYLVGDSSWPFLCILDITNLYSPTLVDSYDTYSDLGAGITILDNFAYIGLGLPGLSIWDITDPTSAKPVGGYGTFSPDNCTTVVAVSGNYAYIPKDNRLDIVDISNPASSKLAGTYDGVSASDVAVSGNYAYLAAVSNGLVILRVETVSDTIPPASVTNLKESSVGSNWINWVWINPTDADFSHVIVYLDSSFVTNTSDGFYNATGLAEGTTHTISTRTVDTSNNINPTWVNDSATTTNQTDTRPPASVTNLKDSGVGQSWIKWTWINPEDADFSHAMIYIDGVFLTNTTSNSINSYNATGLAEGATYIIGLHTVDTSGNINNTWVNNSATTTLHGDATPPASVTNLEEAGTGQNWIKWTWVNPTDVDFSHVMVYLDGSFVTNTSDGFYTATELGNLYISDLDVGDEWVKVKNSGSSIVNLTGWQIKDEGDIHTYTFPSFQLQSGATVTLHTTKGNNTETELYWGSDGFIWNDEGDTAYLYNSCGYLVDSLRSGTTHTIKETTHIISTKTVDSSGNTNPTWVNDTATTSSPSSGGDGGGGTTTKKSAGGGGGGASSAENFANVAMKDVESEYLRMNANATYEFTKEGNPIQSVSFYSLKNSGQITSTIEVLNNRSKLVNSSPEGMVYKYINIWVGKSGFATESNIKDARIRFKVTSSWLQEIGVSPADVKLQRYSGTAWEVLPTTPENNTTGYAIFESQTPGFSPFAITAERVVVSSVTGEAETTPIQTEEVGVKETQPENPRIWTFVIAILVIGVFAAGYVYLKRQQGVINMGLIKIVLKWVLITFVVLVLLGMFLGEPPEQPNKSTDQLQQTTEPAKETPTKEPQSEVYSVGDRVVVGDIAYTVTNARMASSIGDSTFGDQADGVFVIVDMKLENLGKETITMSSSYVKAIDSQGRVFESDSGAWIYLEDNLLLKQLQPGLPTNGQAVFDVPTGETIMLKVTGSFWGGDEKIIVLGKT